MHIRMKVNTGIIAVWGMMSVLYYIGKIITGGQQLEYREWVNNWYVLLFWFIPLLLIGVNFWLQLRKLHEQEKGRKLRTICFSIYCIFSVMFFMAAIFLYALMHDTTETTLDDGNFRIGVRAGSQTEYYYAEPVNLFTRKAFEWNNDKYAESLSKTYDAVFQYTGDDENGNPQFAASEYFDIKVTVYGIDDDGSNALDEDLRFMVTSARLQEEREKYFISGEEFELYYEDYFGWSSPKNPVYALVVYDDLIEIEETAEDIVAFIKNECENAVRADGKPLYEKMYGSIYILFKSSDGSEYIGTRNIPYANYDSIWVNDENVSVEDIISDLESGFR